VCVYVFQLGFGLPGTRPSTEEAVSYHDTIACVCDMCERVLFIGTPSVTLHMCVNDWRTLYQCLSVSFLP